MSYKLRRTMRTLSLTVEYNGTELPDTYNAEKQPGVNASIFYTNFIKKCFEIIFGRVIPDITDKGDREYRRLMAKKVQLDISRKEKEAVDFDEVLMFIQSANIVFSNEIAHLKRDLILKVQDQETRDYIAAAFDKLGRLYSKDDFINRIFADAGLSQRKNKKNIS